MQIVDADLAAQNRDYQVAFARNLIDTLGLDEALDICARNCWAGSHAAVAHERNRQTR